VLFGFPAVLDDTVIFFLDDDLSRAFKEKFKLSLLNVLFGVERLALADQEGFS